MTRKNALPVLLQALVIAGILAGCQKLALDDLEFAERTGEYAFPVFSTRIGMQDLMLKVLNDSVGGDTIVINPDKTMTLFYSGDVAEKPASDIFRFFNFPEVPVPINDTFYSYPFNTLDSVYIRRVEVATGTLNLVVNNARNQPITGTFQILQMSKNGQPFSMSFTVPARQTFISPPIPLKGYTLTSDSNRLEFRYEAYLPDGTRIKIDEVLPGIAGIGILIQGFTASYMEGYWGYSEYPLTLDTIDIDINQTNLKGNVKVKNPKVTMTITNSWGFPTRGVVKYLSFIGRDGKEYKLKSNVFFGDSIDFNYPSWAAGEIGQTKETHVVLDSTNSNIAEIFNAQPIRLIYEVAGISNARKDPSIVGFLTDKSTIALRMKVELLLEGSAENFGAEQTINANFGQFADFDTSRIEAVEFKIVTENNTPIGAALQLYFLDDQGRVLDSLFSGATPPFVVKSPPVNANGVSIGTARAETFAPMDVARFSRVRQATSMRLNAAFTTAQGGQAPVKLLATQDIALRMGLKVKTRLGGKP
ncbi:MAG: hypothetical protein RMJ33_09010 [Saprospiraceae bacterium]|nr:hypothetical protein [Saprospiraceae bacterium]MDW8229963.1 hypothetical protein [Saprospiraceae bacterium]